MPSTLPVEVEVRDSQTTRIRGTLVAEDGATPLPGSTLTTLTATIYALDAAQTVILATTSIKNANNGTIDEAGLLTYLILAAQMALLDTALPYERHIVLLRWSWGANPVKHGAAEVALILRNLAKVP